MRPPSPPNSNFSLENLLVRGKLSCYNKESWKDRGLQNVDIHFSFREAIQFSRAALLLTPSKEPSSLKSSLHHSPGHGYRVGTWSWVTATWVTVSWKERTIWWSYTSYFKLRTQNGTVSLCSCSMNLVIWSHRTSRDAWTWSLTGKSLLWLQFYDYKKSEEILLDG